MTILYDRYMCVALFSFSSRWFFVVGRDVGIGARSGKRPRPGAMSDRGPTPCARGRCLPLIQPFSLVPEFLSRAFNAALGKRQTRKKHHGICLPLVVSLSLSLSISLSFYLSPSPFEQSRESAIGGQVKGSEGTIGATRQQSPLLTSALCSCCSFRSSSRISTFYLSRSRT